MYLHELHRRRLEVTVRLIENSLNRMEGLLREGGESGIASAVTNTLSEEERERVFERLGQLRCTLRDFGKHFLLERQTIDLRQALNAELSSAWVMLENCRPERMRGYGVAFETGVGEALEEHLQGLLAQIIALRARLP